MTLPINIATSYLDRSPGDAAHQVHHDAIHAAINEMKEGGSSGQVWSVGGASPGWNAPDNSSLVAHEIDPTPHAVYDDMPSMTLLFENGLV